MLNQVQFKQGADVSNTPVDQFGSKQSIPAQPNEK